MLSAALLALTLDQNTGLSIGLVATLVTTIIGCAVYITRELTAVKNRLMELEGDRFTMSQAAEQALRTAIENPGMRVPDPRNPGKVFHVQAGGVHTGGVEVRA